MKGIKIANFIVSGVMLCASGGLILSGQRTLMGEGIKSEQKGAEGVTGSISYSEPDQDAAGVNAGIGSASATGADVAGESSTMEATDSITVPDQETAAGTLPENDREVVIDVVGDIMPSQYVLDNYDASGIQGVISEELQAELTGADVTLANEEFPFGTTGSPMEDKQFTFQVAPDYVSILQELGVDVVTLANNHSLDYGKEALSETFTTLDEAGILYVGAGANVEEASALKVMECGERRIGFLAASRVIPDVSWNVENGGPAVLATYEATLLNQAIASARENCDYLIVYVHWGIERNTEPEAYERTLAEGYIDNGADVVIGSHPHVVQGVDWYQNKPIFYSLGNFIFYQDIAQTMVLKITLQEDMTPEFKILPAKAAGACTSFMTPEEGSGELNYMEELSYSTSIDEEGIVTEQIN